jgi:hypothetical protein
MTSGLKSKLKASFPHLVKIIAAITAESNAEVFVFKSCVVCLKQVMMVKCLGKKQLQRAMMDESGS